MLESLACEYLAIIDRIRYHDFANDKELRWLAGQRAVIHDQICKLLGIPHDSDITDLTAIFETKRPPHQSGCFHLL